VAHFLTTIFGSIYHDREQQMVMNTAPAGIAVNSIETRLKTHGLAVGLRYHF